MCDRQRRLSSRVAEPTQLARVSAGRPQDGRERVPRDFRRADLARAVGRGLGLWCAGTGWNRGLVLGVGEGGGKACACPPGATASRSADREDRLGPRDVELFQDLRELGGDTARLHDGLALGGGADRLEALDRPPLGAASATGLPSRCCVGSAACSHGPAAMPAATASRRAGPSWKTGVKPLAERSHPARDGARPGLQPADRLTTRASTGGKRPADPPRTPSPDSRRCPSRLSPVELGSRDTDAAAPRFTVR